MENNKKKNKIIVFERKPERDKKDLFLNIITQAQIADIAKTKMRQSLRANNEEETEREICPEIYVDYNAGETTRKEKRTVIEKWAIIVGILSAMAGVFGFLYTIGRDIQKDNKELYESIVILKETSRRSEGVLNKIEDGFDQIKRESILHEAIINGIDVRVKRLEEKKE